MDGEQEKKSEFRYKLWVKRPQCFVCRGEIKKFTDCSIEHVLPRSKGGSNRFLNLSISHKVCNNFRGNIVCRLIWENKKLVIKRHGGKSSNDLLNLWLEKYGLEEADIFSHISN